MLVLVLLGYQALASEWKGEANLDAMLFESAPSRSLDTRHEQENYLVGGIPRPITWNVGSLNGAQNDGTDTIAKLYKSMAHKVVRLALLQKFNFQGEDFFSFLERLLGRTFKNRHIITTRVDGGLWIFGTADELTLSAYSHPTKRHIADVQYDAGQPVWALPDRWAITCGNMGSAPGKPYYKVE